MSRGRSVPGLPERPSFLVSVGLDEDEMTAVLEMMRLTNAATPASVVKTALWKQARFLEVALEPDAFAVWRSASDLKRRAAAKRLRGTRDRAGSSRRKA